MYSSIKEMVTVTAKEIFLKMMEAPGLYVKPGTAEAATQGTKLADHLGDCFESLLKKVNHAIKET